MFKLPNGPWETVFSTKQAEVEVALQTNVESDVAIQITEKTDDRPQGVVLELFRVFVAQRNPQALLEKLPFLALEFGVHSDAATHWFVLCDSGSVYCEPHEQAVADAFSELEKRMERFDDQLVTGARHLEVPLVPFAQSSEGGIGFCRERPGTIGAWKEPQL
jgi:hypothetical protein